MDCYGKGLKGPMQGKGSPMRDAPTRRLTANVPHGFFGRLIKRFALRSPRQVAAQAQEVAGVVVEQGAREPAC